MSPRRDSESENPSTNGGRKPFTRPNSAQRGAREALSRRLSAGDPRSEQSPRRRIPVGLSTSSVFPSGVEVFVDQVVPLLQQRGVFRREYTGSTLRDHLGLPYPASQYQRAAEAV